MPPLYSVPQIVPLNTREGYIINPVTGDSIKPIINSLGDTVKTEVPVPARGKVIDPGSLAKLKVVPAGEPEVFPIHLNEYKIPETLTVIPVNKDSLTTFTPGIDTSSFVLVNSFGDTIPTDVSIPARGKVVPCRQPQPVKALLPRMKDNASIDIKCLDKEQGMSSSRVWSTLEDSRGNLWFGTDGGGVIKYDGETFMHFTTIEGLSHNTVLSILEDSHDNLWFGTHVGGLSMYNGDSFIHFTEKEGLSNNHVWCMLEDDHGNLWFGTRKGVSMYNGKTFTHFTQKEGLRDNCIATMLEDSRGRLWFGTCAGVSMYDGEIFVHYIQNKDLRDNSIGSIVEDSDNNIWLGTHNGSIRLVFEP